MATATHPVGRTSETHHRLSATAGLITVFWLGAAMGAVTAQKELDPISPAGGAAATIVAIVLSACGYTRAFARYAGLSHALAVGMTWLLLGIVAEMTMTAHLGHAWYSILGPPAHPLLRDVLLLVWIFAPAVFARGEGAAA